MQERDHNDRLAAKYYAIWDQPIQISMTEIQSQWLSEGIAERSRVLVCGCGGGRELAVLLKKQCEITAVDLSPGMIAAGQERYRDQPIMWMQADLQDLPAFPHQFDAAIMLGGVINYLPEPALALGGLKAALEPGSKLLFDSINENHASEIGSTNKSVSRTRRPYGIDRIRALVEEAGFSLVKARGIRFFVDLLPDDWNVVDQVDDERSRVMAEILRLEHRLPNLLPAGAGRFIWVEAEAG